MQACVALRKQAAQKRDAIIKAARAEFNQTILAINSLQRQLSHTRPPKLQVLAVKPRPIVDRICDLAPRDRTFTMAEVVEMMSNAEPRREFHVPTVRTFFNRLEKQGVIRRVRRASGNVLGPSRNVSFQKRPTGPCDYRTLRRTCCVT